MKYMKITVINLSTDTEYTYIDVEPKHALVTTWFLENNGASQIHNQRRRKQMEAKITTGNHSLSLDDLCVMKPKELKR